MANIKKEESGPSEATLPPQQSVAPPQPQSKQKSGAVASPPPMLMGDVLAYKTRLCNSYLGGTVCRYGPRCRFAHGNHDLRTQDDNFRHGLTSEQALIVFQAAMRNRPDGSTPLPVAGPAGTTDAAMPQAQPSPVGFLQKQPPVPVQQFPSVQAAFDHGMGDLSMSWSLDSSLPSFGSPAVPVQPLMHPSSLLYMTNQQQHNALYTLVPAAAAAANPAGGAAGVAAGVHHQQMVVQPMPVSQHGMQPVYFPQPQPMVFMGYAGGTGTPYPQAGPMLPQAQQQLVYPLWP